MDKYRICYLVTVEAELTEEVAYDAVILGQDIQLLLQEKSEEFLISKTVGVQMSSVRSVNADKKENKNG